MTSISPIPKKPTIDKKPPELFKLPIRSKIINKKDSIITKL